MNPPNNWSDYAVEARGCHPNNGYGWTVGGRLNPVSGRHYGAFLLPYGQAMSGQPYSWVLRLVKFTGWDTWSGTTLENQRDVSVGAIDTNYHNLRMTCEGNRVKVHSDGVQKFDVVDNNFEGPVYANGGFAGPLCDEQFADEYRGGDRYATGAGSHGHECGGCGGHGNKPGAARQYWFWDKAKEWGGKIKTKSGISSEQ